MPDHQLTLSGSNQPQPIGSTGISFSAPGLAGTLFVDERPARGLMAAAERSGLRDSSAIAGEDALDRAIDEIGLGSYNLETDAATPLVARPEGVRSETGGIADDEAVVDYEPKPDEFSFLIYRDEQGAISLHFPEGLGAPEKALSSESVRAAITRTHHYRIELRQPASPPAGREGMAPTRFGIVAIGKKLLKLVVGKILKKAVGPLVGAADYGAVWLWESRARAFQGFHGGPDAKTLLADPPAPMKTADWAALEGDKKSLLFLHGTTSTTGGAFGALVEKFPDAAKQLYGRYGNRVIGFNHHTLSKSVAENVCDFYAGLPPGGTYKFDIICHSRGGLVARALKELSSADISALANAACSSAANFTVDRIVFVGTPNVGTPLADPKDIPHALELLSNVAAFLPGAGLALAGILSGAAFVAENGFRALPGLRNMNPGDAFLTEVNLPAGSGSPSPVGSYCAIQSSFAPNGLLNQVMLKALKYLFRGQLNDVVVPTLGVSDIDGTVLPAAVTKSFGPAESVAHTQYFQQPATWEHILAHLP